MRKPKASQQHRRPTEKPASPQLGKATSSIPAANPRPVRPPRRRPWLLALVTVAMIVWLAILAWMALSAPPAAS